MKHGTLTGYNYHLCRCAACTGAKRKYRREWFRRLAADAKAARKGQHDLA